jgi:hypothetical protein
VLAIRMFGRILTYIMITMYDVLYIHRNALFFFVLPNVHCPRTMLSRLLHLITTWKISNSLPRASSQQRSFHSMCALAESSWLAEAKPAAPQTIPWLSIPRWSVAAGAMSRCLSGTFQALLLNPACPSLQYLC